MEQSKNKLAFYELNAFAEAQTYIDGFVQDCSNSIAYALELLQSCTKPSISLFSIISRHWKARVVQLFPHGRKWPFLSNIANTKVADQWAADVSR